MSSRPQLALPLLLLAAGACDTGSDLRGGPDAASTSTPPGQPAPPPPPAGEGSIAKVAARADVPLAGPVVEAKPGDWMLRNAGSVAVVSTAKGRLIDFGAEGGADGVYYVDSVAFDALDRMHVEIARIEPVAEGRVLHVTKRVLDKPLLLHVWFTFNGPALRVESMLTATGPTQVLAVTLGEVVSWGNTPTWVEGHGFISKSGGFGGQFLARESHGLAYAQCSHAGRILGRFSSPNPPGFHEAARTGEELVTVAPNGASSRRAVSFVHSSRSFGDAALALPCARVEKDRFALPAELPEGAQIEVARCPVRPPPPPQPAKPPVPAPDAPVKPSPPRGEPAGSPYLRFGGPGPRKDLELPKGCFVARRVAPGHAHGPWVKPEALATAPDLAPVSGRLRWTVTEGDAPVPAKLLVRGKPPTPDPDWGDDPDAGASLNAVYSADGSGERPLAPGTYGITVQRGPEYTIDEQTVQITRDQTTTVKARLERVVDTAGWIAADLHVHALPSSDAPVLLVDRARSLAAVAVEVAVATDHNAVTDYGPTIRELGLERRLASVVGDEVTTREVFFGHFNAFPLVAGAAPVEAESVPPKPLFAAMRAAGRPGVPTVIQVNHPRMSDIGYFELLRLDPGDVRGWLSRAPLADMGFDALEVFNGDHYAEVKKVERCLADWYALLEAGYRTVATGNSDSHKIGFHEAGVPRNWVAVPSDDPAAFDERAFVEAVRAGRVVVSSGPFVRLRAGGREIGETVAAGEVEVSIEVQAPPWIDVARVELVKRGDVIRTWTGPFAASARRFEVKVSERLEKGDWIIAVVRGDKPMTLLHREGAKPFAFTNPIRVE